MKIGDWNKTFTCIKLHSAEALSTLVKKMTPEIIGSIINIQDFSEQMQGK
jgi:hypothetical protein